MPGIRTSTDVEEKDTPIHEMYRSACCREKRSSGRYSLHLIVGLIPNLCILNCLNETGILDVACIIPKLNTLQSLHQEGLPSLLSPWKHRKTGCKTQIGQKQIWPCESKQEQDDKRPLSVTGEQLCVSVSNRTTDLTAATRRVCKDTSRDNRLKWRKEKRSVDLKPHKMLCLRQQSKKSSWQVIIWFRAFSLRKLNPMSPLT